MLVKKTLDGGSYRTELLCKKKKSKIVIKKKKNTNK